MGLLRLGAGMPWHPILFDEDKCIVPEGVDPDIWLLELPSILGAAYYQRTVEEDEPITPTESVGSGEWVVSSEARAGSDMRQQNSLQASPDSAYALTEIDEDEEQRLREQIGEADEEDGQNVEQADCTLAETQELVANCQDSDPLLAPDITLEVPYARQPEELI